MHPRDGGVCGRLARGGSRSEIANRFANRLPIIDRYQTAQPTDYNFYFTLSMAFDGIRRHLQRGVYTEDVGGSSPSPPTTGLSVEDAISTVRDACSAADLL